MQSPRFRRQSLFAYLEPIMFFALANEVRRVLRARGAFLFNVLAGFEDPREEDITVDPVDRYTVFTAHPAAD